LARWEKKEKVERFVGAKLSVASYFVSFCLVFMKDSWALHSHAQADTLDNFLSANERR